MPSRRTITAEQLAPLGVERLAKVLAECASSFPEVAERVQYALEASGSGKALASKLRKQIARLASGKRFYEYYECAPFIAKLETVRASIMGDLLPSNPTLAVELLGEFLDRTGQFLERVEDERSVGKLLERVFTDWAQAWEHVPPAARDTLPEQSVALGIKDRYGITDGLFGHLTEVLGRKGLERCKALLMERLEGLPVLTPASEANKPLRVMLGPNADLDIALSMVAEQAQGREVQLVTHDGYPILLGAQAERYQLAGLLRDLADAMGDTTLYIHACVCEGREDLYGAEIGKRLLEAQRAEEALPHLEAATVHSGNYESVLSLRAQALEELGRTKDAQALRWESFTTYLSELFYVAYVDHAPPAERDSTQARAISAAHAHADMAQAVRFLTWLRDDAALTRLLESRWAELDGREYRALTKAASFLSEVAPEMGVKLYRWMVTDILERKASKQYTHAAKHLARAAACAYHLPENTTLSSHARFLTDLHTQHGRKRSFWTKVKSSESEAA